MSKEVRRADHRGIGAALRERRRYHGWTLAEMGERTGVSLAALSKIENDRVMPSYHTILQLCDGLDIEVSDLIGSGSRGQTMLGRRSVSRQHAGETIESTEYTYTYLCTDVAHKRIIPMVVDIRAKSLTNIDGLWSHIGEEFIYVLKGEIVLHTDPHEPIHLDTSDSVYIDSTMRHAFLASGPDPAQILVLCSSATPNLAQTLREILVNRLASSKNIIEDSIDRDK